MESLETIGHFGQPSLPEQVKKNNKTWQERQTSIENLWIGERTNILKSYLHKISFIHANCLLCRRILETSAIRCLTCCKHFCWECDVQIHSKNPFHRRSLMCGSTQQVLKPTVFFDENWEIYEMGMKDIFKKAFIFILALFYLQRYFRSLVSTIPVFILQTRRMCFSYCRK